MMLNDVVNEKTIDNTIIEIYAEKEIIDKHNLGCKLKEISEIEYDQGNVYLIVKLPSWYITELNEKYERKYGFILPLGRQIEESIRDFNLDFGLQHHPTSSLVFDGKEPRRDVLQRLLKIADAMFESDSYPIFVKPNLDKILRSVLGPIDPRTMKKYQNCLKIFVERTTGRRFRWNEQCNLKHFRDAVVKKLEALDT